MAGVPHWHGAHGREHGTAAGPFVRRVSDAAVVGERTLPRDAWRRCWRERRALCTRHGLGRALDARRAAHNVVPGSVRPRATHRDGDSDGLRAKGLDARGTASAGAGDSYGSARPKSKGCAATAADAKLSSPRGARSNVSAGATLGALLAACADAREMSCGRACHVFFPSQAWHRNSHDSDVGVSTSGHVMLAAAAARLRSCGAGAGLADARTTRAVRCTSCANVWTWQRQQRVVRRTCTPQMRSEPSRRRLPCCIENAGVICTATLRLGRKAATHQTWRRSTSSRSRVLRRAKAECSPNVAASLHEHCGMQHAPDKLCSIHTLKLARAAQRARAQHALASAFPTCTT